MKPDWEGFGRAIMSTWAEGGVDGFELQYIAERYGILRLEKYNPEKHGAQAVEEFGIEPGDAWYVPNYSVEGQGND